MSDRRNGNDYVKRPSENDYVKLTKFHFSTFYCYLKFILDLQPVHTIFALKDDRASHTRWYFARARPPIVA